MNVTKTGVKGSQLPAEGSMQKDSAEHEGYAGVHNPVRITENNNTNASESKEGLLEKIASRDNLNQAFKRVKANKGSHGIDGMKVDELLQYLKENGETLKQSILDGTYRPNPVRRRPYTRSNSQRTASDSVPRGVRTVPSGKVRAT
jgi:RNA-directed DNA polymerase